MPQRVASPCSIIFEVFETEEYWDIAVAKRNCILFTLLAYSQQGAGFGCMARLSRSPCYNAIEIVLTLLLLL